LSGSPTQLNKEARSWRVRSKRLLDGARNGLLPSLDEVFQYHPPLLLEASAIAAFTRRYTPNTPNHSARLTIEAAIAEARSVCRIQAKRGLIKRDNKEVKSVTPKIVFTNGLLDLVRLVILNLIEAGLLTNSALD